MDEKKFQELKQKHPDALILFRVGDFYESYNIDANTCAEVLGITLSKIDGEFVAGFPAQALDTYLPKLIRAGHRVAISDELKPQPQPVKQRITEKVEKAVEVRNLPISDVEPSPSNPRKTFVQEELEELAASIKSQGLLQPITVRPSGEGYEVVCGERRYRACKLNEMETIPCIVREMTDDEALDAMICENLNRKDVEPIEEAFAFAQLKKRGDTAEDIAIRFGKSVRFVNDRIHLNDLIPQLMLKVKDGIIPIGGAMQLCKLDAVKQNEYFNSIKEREMKVQKYEIERFIDNLFCRIETSPWYKDGDDDFKGECQKSCAECPFNTLNAKCLFYEMNADEEDAQCTCKEKFIAKRDSFIVNKIVSNGAELMKRGEAFPLGKAVVVTNKYYGTEKDENLQDIVNAVRLAGYEVVENLSDVFEGYSSYSEGDERLEEKLQNREVYKVYEIVSMWNGIDIHVKYRKFNSRKEEDMTSEDMKAQATAGNLLAELSANTRKCNDAIIAKLRADADEVAEGEMSNLPLTKNEKILLMILALRQCKFHFRESVCDSIIDYCENNLDKFNMVARKLMAKYASDSGTQYTRELAYVQEKFLKEHAPDKYEETCNYVKTRYAKKNEQIIDKLNELGFDENGEKIHD